MAISFDTNQFTTAVQTLQKVVAAGANTLAHVRVLSSDLVELSAVNKGVGLSLKIPARVGKADKEKSFSVEPTALLALVGGRTDISLEIQSSTVHITAKGYEADLLTSSLEIEDVIPEEAKKGDKVKVGQEVVEFIAQALPGIELKPMLNTENFMPVSVKVTSKGARIICYDNWHMAYYEDKKVTGDFEVTLPYSSLALLTKEFGGLSFSLVATEASLYAFNKSFQLALTLPQQESQNKIPAKDAFELLGSLRQKDSTSIDLATQDLKLVASNMDAIYKKGESVDFDVTASSCNVTLKSTHGKVSSSIRCRSKGSAQFRTGFAFLKDALSKLPENKVTFEVVGSHMLFFRKGKFMYMIALLDKDSGSKSKKKKQE